MNIYKKKIFIECLFTFPECELGFKSRKGNTCEPCANNLYGEGCAHQCMCNVTDRYYRLYWHLILNK